jgi:hypothetical protein
MSAAYNRWVASWDDYTDAEIVRRSADDLRRHASPDQARRLDKVADHLDALAALLGTPTEDPA